MNNRKVLMITGASSEVGNALISNIIQSYDIVLAHYNHSIDSVEKLKKKYGEKIIPIQADFSDDVSINKMITYIKNLEMYPDHIVHLAASKIFNSKFKKIDWENFKEDIDKSLRPIVMILHSFIPLMEKNHYGKIVFMLSSGVINNPPKYQSSYVTSKYALLGLMKSLSVEYAEKGIMVNAVSPEMIDTQFLSEVPELIVKQYAQASPTGRNLKVEEVVPAFEYLLSDKADAVTGVNLLISGGR